MHIKKFNILFCLLFSGLLFANNTSPGTPLKLNSGEVPTALLCDHPAPTNFHTEEIGTDYVKLAWSPTGPSPFMWVVRTFESSGSTLFSTDVIAGNLTDWTVTGLATNTAYYCSITPMCAGGEESAHSVSTPDFMTLIIDLILSGFTPLEESPSCSIMALGNSCEVLPNETTYFKIFNRFVSTDVRYFSVSITSGASGNRYHVTLLPSSVYTDYLLLCDGLSTPVCAGAAVEIRYAGVRVATFSFKSSVGTNPMLYATSNFFNAGHRITKIGAVPTPQRLEPTIRPKERNALIDNLHTHFFATTSPNPFTDHLDVQVQLANENETATFNLYDLQGRLVIAQNTITGSNMQSLNTASLASGMYFLRVSSGGEYKTIKVVKTQ